MNDHESARMVVAVARSGTIPPKADTDRLAYPWSEVCHFAQEGGREGLHTALEKMSDRDRAESMLRSVERAESEPEDGGPITIRTPPPFDLGVIGSADFASARYPREYLIKRVMVKGKPGIIGGPRKALKTSFVVDMGISLATGTRFLDQFDVPRRIRTLIISGESGEATIQETMRRVCRSRGIEPQELEGFLFWGFTLPQLGNTEHLDALRDFIRSNGIEAVIIDPLYLCLISGVRKIDPASLFDVGPLLKTICDVCLEAGATPLLVHHFRKNRETPYGVPDMDDLAFAGTQEFARQWILLSRRERYLPGSGEHKLWLSVGGSDGHSGEWSVDVSEGAVDENFSDREWRVAIATASDAILQAREQAAASRQQAAVERDRTREEAKVRKIHDDAELALEAIAKATDGRKTKSQWRDGLGWNSTRFNPVAELLLEQGRVRTVDDVSDPSADGRKWKKSGFAFVRYSLESTTLDNPGQPWTKTLDSPPSPGFKPNVGNPGLLGGLTPKGVPPTVQGSTSGVDTVIADGSPPPKKRRGGKSPGLDASAGGMP